MIAYHIRITGNADRKATKRLPTICIPTAKIMQGERNTKQKVFFVLIPEPQPLLCGMKIAKTFLKVTE